MSGHPKTGFELDPQLAAETAFIVDLPLSRVLLMDDARFPWLILVPRRAGLAELADLADSEQGLLLREIGTACTCLRAIAPCEKLNIGLLGNVVRQLHVHVVARRSVDAAWPGPVWGSGTPQRYDPATRGALIERARHGFVTRALPRG